MRQFKTKPRIIAEEVFYSPSRGYHRAMLRYRPEDYIGGSGQIIDFSADGGTTWQRVANFTPTDFQDIFMAYDGTDTYVISCGTTVAGNDGFFRSTNNGASFARVSSITGFDFVNDLIHGLRYGTGSKLWMTVGVDFDDESAIFSSSDDGSSWTNERQDGGDPPWAMTHNDDGILFVGAGGINQPSGIFDADGASLGTPTTNILGVQTNEELYGAGLESRALFADNTSDFPSRFWAIIYDAIVDRAYILYSDDSAATWKRANIGTDTSFATTFAGDCKVWWDGRYYHVILVGDVDTHLWSRDGTAWHYGPMKDALGDARLDSNVNRYGSWTTPTA